MADPISLKAITDAISSFWGRSALLLWCLSACAWASWGVIFAGKHFQFDLASEAVASVTARSYDVSRWTVQRLDP